VVRTRLGPLQTPFDEAFLTQLANEAIQHVVKWLERGAWPDLCSFKIRPLPRETYPLLAAALKRRKRQMVSLPPYLTQGDQRWRVDHMIPGDEDQFGDEDMFFG
jgi:hypothetical protein